MQRLFVRSFCFCSTSLNDMYLLFKDNVSVLKVNPGERSEVTSSKCCSSSTQSRHVCRPGCVVNYWQDFFFLFLRSAPSVIICKIVLAEVRVMNGKSENLRSALLMALSVCPMIFLRTMNLSSVRRM